MEKVIGICNLHDDPSLGLITANRPLGALTFLGRYGVIDFTLSNFSNSGIDKMFVLVKQGMIPMRSHIGSGSIWVRNTIRGSITLLLNESGLSNPKFNTDIANLKANLNFNNSFDYAVIAPSFMVASIDYNPIVEEHIKSGKQISVVYTHVKKAENEFVNCDALKLGANKKIEKVSKHTGKGKKEADISIESFVISKKMLIQLLDEAPTISEFYSLRQIINYKINEGTLDVNAIEYTHFIVPILDIEHYIDYSFKLLDEKTRNKLFKNEWPIYTTTHNTPPALYGPNAEVTNSFIANGSIINGKVKNCIISRDVVIESGAEVSNSIIFTHTLVGSKIKMKYVLTDKEVKIVESKENYGTADKFLYVKYGAKI